jgi:ribosome biogenesis GTPase
MDYISKTPYPTEHRLADWGWNAYWAQVALDYGATEDYLPIDPPHDQTEPVPSLHPVEAPDPGILMPARVIRHVHHHYQIVAPIASEPVWAEVSGAFSYRAAGPADYPTAGDWVLCDGKGRIEKLLPRKTTISRQSAGGETLEQVITANIDVIFLVFGMDGGRNFTVGMLERSLLVAWNSGARPVVVLNKADVADPETVARIRSETERSATGVSVHTVSAHRGDGLEALLAEANPGQTVGMLGKSGVGKSALLNAFVRAVAPDAPQPARTGEQRRGDRQGRHTTTEKVLHILPGGVILADVPGLRELQLWGDGDELPSSFPEIDALAAECRFGDCAHDQEPGCRVQEALASGELAEDRYERYLQYQRELAYLERRRDQRAGAEERKKWKRIAMEQRRIKKG